MLISKNYTVYNIESESHSLFCVDSLEAETASFLGSKDKWKKEIDDKLEDLKVMEHSLTSKEAELNKVRGQRGRGLVVLANASINTVFHLYLYYRITKMFCEHQTYYANFASVDQFATIKSQNQN